MLTGMAQEDQKKTSPRQVLNIELGGEGGPGKTYFKLLCVLLGANTSCSPDSLLALIARAAVPFTLGHLHFFDPSHGGTLPCRVCGGCRWAGGRCHANGLTAHYTWASGRCHANGLTAHYTWASGRCHANGLTAQFMLPGSAGVVMQHANGLTARFMLPGLAGAVMQTA